MTAAGGAPTGSERARTRVVMILSENSLEHARLCKRSFAVTLPCAPTRYVPAGSDSVMSFTTSGNG